MEWQGNYYQRDRGLQPPAFTPGYKTTGLRSPRKPLLSLQHSLSEVPGPVFGRHELDPLDNDLIHNHVRDGEAIGQRIIVQGRVPGRRGHGPMAPHISFCIVARGINIGLNTRMYFADEAAANTGDPVLGLVEQEERRQTLIAPRESRGGAGGLSVRCPSPGR